MTQVLDRPRTGRGLFEEVMRENLDLGRPDQMQLIFNRRVSRQTPGPFRTRILTDGVVPSLHVDYKKSRVKQYHKEDQALRTETTINNTYDFEIGRALRNLPALREIGFAANRRLLRVEYLSHDCLIGDDHLDALTQPIVVDTQRAAALRVGDRRVLALMQTLCLFALSPTGLSPSGRPPATSRSCSAAAPDAVRRRSHDLRPAPAAVTRTHRTCARRLIAIASLNSAPDSPSSMSASMLAASGPPRHCPPRAHTAAPQAMERLDAALTKFLQEVRLVA